MTGVLSAQRVAEPLFPLGALGLTRSLPIGHELSPRGRAVPASRG